MSATLNPLSYPKGKEFKCEICGKPAVLQCTGCRVTFYCTREHQEEDAAGIHDKICALLVPLRTPAEEIGSEEDRARRQRTVAASHKALVELTRTEASRYLVQRDYRLAIPAALQALRFSMKVYGEGHLDLVPAYLLLAEANLGMRRFKSVEEFLAMARWRVLKHPDCSNTLRSKLERMYGQLYAAKGEHDAALAHLSKDVYHASLELGPEHINTAAGYFHMGVVFADMGQVEQSLAFYDKVVDVWYKFLVSLRNTGDEAAAALPDAQVAEAMSMLQEVAKTRHSVLGATHIAYGEVEYTMGLLYVYTGDVEEAQVALKSAKAIYSEQLGDEHPSTKDVCAVMEDLQRVPDAV